MSTRKLDPNGFTRYDRQRAAFIAGVLQAIQDKCFPISAWQYKGSGALRSYARGFDKGRDVLADLLEREGY